MLSRGGGVRQVVKRPARLAAAALAVAAVLTALPTALPSSSGATASAVEPRAHVGRTFYVDPRRGSDRFSGRSVSRPFRTLGPVSGLSLRPGDKIRLRAGTQQIGSLTLSGAGTQQAPIRVGSYGRGKAPIIRGGKCVEVNAPWVSISHVAAWSCAYAGFLIWSDHVTLTKVEAADSVAGVTIQNGADYAVVRRSWLHENARMAANTPGSSDDYGANGVVVSGDYAQIIDNRISDHLALSHDFGMDGSAVEIWGAIGTRVLRNVASNNLTFTELGNARTADTEYAYNVVTSGLPDANFLVTRGGGQFGPVRNTTAHHNTVVLTGARALAISCDPDCGPGILTIGSNVVRAANVGYAGAADGTLAGISVGRNVFDQTGSDGYFGLRMAANDVVGRANFVDLEHGDLRLRADSPAVDIGGPAARVDILGRLCPQDGNGDGQAAADAGAYERQPA